jgi:hypothetical protein
MGNGGCDGIRCLLVIEEFVEEVLVSLDGSAGDVKRAEEEWMESLWVVECARRSIRAQVARRIPSSSCFVLQEGEGVALPWP